MPPSRLHNALMLSGILYAGGPGNDLARVKELAVADLVATVLPSAVGALGLWRLKAWGWVLAMLACGGYLHGLLVLLTCAALSSRFGPMSAVSVYLIAFSLIVVGYLWKHRRFFSWE